MAKKRKRKINTKKIKFIFLILILIVIFIAIKKSEIIYNSDEFSLIINNEDVTSQLENDIVIINDKIYLSYNDIKKTIDNTIYNEDEKIITTSDKKVAMLELDKNVIEINGAKVNIKGQAFKDRQDVIYIPISEMQNVYDIEFTYVESTKNIIIDNYSKALIKADAKKNIKVKSKKSKFSSNIAKVKKGDWVIYVSEENGWTKIRTQEGILGFVKSKQLTNFVTQREDMKEEGLEKNEPYIEENISKKDIKSYNKRKKVIEKILQNVVQKDYKAVKIIYKEDNNEYIDRFKIEAKPIFKECGINVFFD